MFLTTGETTVKTHALCFVAVLLALPPFPNIASAQTTASAGVRVSGTVFDSISALQLRGASVQIVGAAGDIVGRRFTAISDSTGRYSIAGVPSGSYIAGFQHARLDSLGLEIEEQRLQVGLDLLTLRLEPGREFKRSTQVRQVFVNHKARSGSRQLDDMPIGVASVDALEIDAVHHRRNR